MTKRRAQLCGMQTQQGELFRATSTTCKKRRIKIAALWSQDPAAGTHSSTAMLYSSATSKQNNPKDTKGNGDGFRARKCNGNAGLQTRFVVR